MFDMVNLLTNGRAGLDHRARPRSRSSARRSRSGAPATRRRFAIILFVAVFGLANIYVKALNRGEEPMSACASASAPPIRSSSPSPRASASRRRSSCSTRCITLVPLVWILAHQLQEPARLDQLPAQGGVRAVDRGLLQPVHDALAADRGVHRRACRRPPSTCDERRARRTTWWSPGRSNYRAALRQLADHRLRLDRCSRSASA